MPAVRADLIVEAGSYEPQYWVITDPDSGQPLDLTAPGYLVHAVVSSREDGTGDVLLDLPDTSVWRRTADGRIYFEPPSALSAGWGAVRGFYQAELSHPAGETVRFSQGRFIVDPELVKD
ncbi:hypothetical protein [Pseudonocardia asaccharolytica]|uniref:Uncharacterized protein n=1 Tax=Pseudonocardia asaccharolytica DSM 44247 = NBRC 16224 TaxID=1123024 RepID=A0A511D7Q7_9PSEU|nr:hypothetical protein [Pseudonocardia asaccharolytica]GEL20845.1 hypothetical protein PA7_46820 [Pseudonocardia asaccharolytica DSM 44247 = NBRC 16224]